MATTKRFKAKGGGRIQVSMPGRGWIELSDEVYETDDPEVIAALKSNPDAEQVKERPTNKEKS